MTFSDVFCIFLGQENWNVRIRAPCIVILWRRDHATCPPVPDWLCPRSDRASEIDIARIRSSAEVSVCFSFRYLVFIFVPTCHHKVRKARLNDCCGRGSCHAASDTARAWRHVVRLISSVSENSNTWPLYPDTVPLSFRRNTVRMFKRIVQLRYCIAGNFQGRKPLQILQFYNYPWKFSPRNFNHATILIHESFPLETSTICWHCFGHNGWFCYASIMLA